MKTKLHDPFVIETDFKADVNFFQDYLDKVEWTDTNKLYGEHEEYNELCMEEMGSSLHTACQNRLT